ncbi:hypothetical protein D210916BOD24_10820 [Alteromonas sp. D210916BOD_24]
MAMYTPTQYSNEVLQGTRQPITVRRWCETGKIIGYKGVHRVEKTPTGGWLIHVEDHSTNSNVDALVQMMKHKAA